MGQNSVFHIHELIGVNMKRQRAAVKHITNIPSILKIVRTGIHNTDNVANMFYDPTGIPKMYYFVQDNNSFPSQTHTRDIKMK